jgi:hypothetical protein
MVARMTDMRQPNKQGAAQLFFKRGAVKKCPAQKAIFQGVSV